MDGALGVNDGVRKTFWCSLLLPEDMRKHRLYPYLLFAQYIPDCLLFFFFSDEMQSLDCGPLFASVECLCSRHNEPGLTGRLWE